jgi:hypothetical protein
LNFWNLLRIIPVALSDTFLAPISSDSPGHPEETSEFLTLAIKVFTPKNMEVQVKGNNQVLSQAAQRSSLCLFLINLIIISFL